jgi:predicted O-methyltransferase YrrM
VTDKDAAVQWSTANSLARNVQEAVEFALHSAESIMSWVPGGAAYFRNRTVLEIGPGQDLGMPFILMGFGARMVLIDRYLCQWDPNFHPQYYRALRERIVERFPAIETAPLDQVIEKSGHAITDLRMFEVGLENIYEVSDASIDVSYSNATFEHLMDPRKAILQLARVTRPGGLGFHQIDFRDHRNFQRPLEYLTGADEDSEHALVSMASRFGNGLRSTEFEQMFKESGFHIRQFEPNSFADEQYLSTLMPRLRSKYKSMPTEALRILGGRFYLVKPFSDDPWFHSILSGYADLGYPPELITSWALPFRDARTLAELTDKQKPRNVLEVGTFVGVSTLVMAARLPEGAMIHTIDPNFPLNVELTAMNTPARGADLTTRHQQLALEVARRLRVAHKITFHAGGFSTSATFASSKHDTSLVAPVIGPKVCEEQGPFDLVFIDGLHYTEAVLSDLRLASRHLKPGGQIVVHDVIGMWGSNVRRAVFQFLSETPNFSFQHGKYSDMFDAIGILQHWPDSNRSMTDSVRLDTNDLLERAEFIQNLASVAVNLCAPKSVVCIGRDRGGLLGRLEQLGVEELHQVCRTQGAEVARERNSRVNIHACDFEDTFTLTGSVDLCVFWADGDILDDTRIGRIIDSCVACSDTILFGGTPPGEIGIAAPGARPLAWWVRQFWKRGYRFHDAVRPLFEPLKFAYSFSPVYEVTSSELANLYLIRREPRKESNDHGLMEELLVEKESRIEDMTLQAVYTDIVVHDLLKKWKAAQELVAVQNARLGEYEQREIQVGKMEKELATTEARLRQIEESLEYRMSIQFAKHPKLLHALARIRRIFGVK